MNEITDNRVSRRCAAAVTGVGLGLRAQHYQDILQSRPAVPWFEALSENYMGDGGPPLYHLEQVRQDYPITLHGVGMSLGSVDPLDYDYLAKLKGLMRRFEPAWVSDHLAWISTGQRYMHDLLPLPYTEEALAHLTTRIEQVQDFLGCRLLVENPSSYLAFTGDEMSEWEFIAALLKRADCDLLLDVNNLYVSAMNQSLDPTACLALVPADRVREIHLAGYEAKADYLFDTHGHPVHAPVWELYEEAIRQIGARPTLIEWDTDIPAFERLLVEARIAQNILDKLAA